MTYITAIVPTDRKKRDWQEVIKTREDYQLALKSGMAWVWWVDFPDGKEFQEYLDNKEKED